MQLSAVGYANSERLTLKTFRSSMATQLAKDGKKVEAILAAGEWAGAAIMNYMQLQEIDESKLLLEHLQFLTMKENSICIVSTSTHGQC